MWYKLVITFHIILLIYHVVNATAANLTGQGSAANSSSCTGPIACKCPVSGDGFTVTNVVNCTDPTLVCVSRMKDYCHNQDVCVCYSGDVQKGPPHVTSLYKNLDAFENTDKVRLSCNIKANPLASLQWLFNGKNIKDLVKSDLYKNHAKPEINCSPQESQLTLFSLKKQLHHGQYACVATNSAGQTNYTFNINVNDLIYRVKPRIQCTAKYSRVYLGSSFNISCSVLFRNAGPSNAQYLRNNRRYEDDERHELIPKDTIFLMVIKNITMDDAGVWELRATQIAVRASEFITLDVVPCPAGYYCPFNESTPRQCQPGTYNDGTNNITYQCRPCPAYDVMSNYTSYIGAKSVDDCPLKVQKQEKVPNRTNPSEFPWYLLGLIGLLSPLVVLVWCWRYAKNKGKQHIWKDHIDATDVQNILYDVFISFSEKDQQFAIELQHNIESQGYKCCFHHRDFCPGEAIVKSITDAIYQSLVTLVVLSPDYIESKWCRQELDQALTAAIGSHKVLPVIYKDCKKIPRQVQSCVTYLEYKPENDRQFWKKLFGAIERFCGHSSKTIIYDSAV